MKKTVIIAALAVLPSWFSYAQTDAQRAAAEAAAAIAGAPKVEAAAPKPKYWTNSLMTNINFIQSSYSSWAKGGVNNYAFSAYIDGIANYQKNNLSWNNRLQMDFGVIYADDKPILQKNKDRLLFESTFGHRATNTMNYTAKLTLLTQFADGYEYKTPSAPEGAPEDWEAGKSDWKNARVLKSSGFSPATITLGFGMDWIPNNWLRVNFAPLTGGVTIVTNEALRQVFGMALKKGHEDSEIEKDPNGLLVNGNIYRPVRFDFGAQLSMDAKLRINDNFDASTQLILFSNFLKNPENIRVNWDNRFMWKVARFFSLNLSTSLIYDDTVMIVDEKHPEGHKAVQFYEALQFGFTYTFASKK